MLVVKAPDVLAGILEDLTASPRHRIDSAKALDDFASNNTAAAAAATDRFEITIVLNADVEKYSQSIRVNADDIAPDERTARCAGDDRSKKG